MKRAKVVLIDDQLANLISLEQHLQNENYDIEKFSSAEEALPRMLRDKVHCVLVDADLPQMDGLEFTRIVKSDKQLMHIPVLLVTGKVMSSNFATRAFEAGAFDYVVKPFNVAMLATKVELLVKYSIYHDQYALIKDYEKRLVSKVISPLEDLDKTPQLSEALSVLRSLKRDWESLG